MPAATKKRQTASFPRLALAVALLGNGFDLWYTLRALTLSPIAREVNPIMRFLLAYPPSVLIYKLVVTEALLLLLYELRRLRCARFGLYFCAAFYCGNTVYQLLTMYHWWE